MLFNCKVLRRKDFTVQPLVAGSGMGQDPNSPKNKNRSTLNGSNISIKRNLMGTRSAFGAATPILNLSPR